MTLFDEVRAIWGTKHVALAARWAKELEAGLPAVERASKLFHRWAPLRFHVSVGEISAAGKGSRTLDLTFSLRYRGQEVATVVVADEPVVVVGKAHAANNAKYFKASTPQGRYPWRKAGWFRKEFETERPGARVRVPEHELEARVLEELEEKTAEKFGGTLGGVRHCGPTTREYPLQFPLPISANTGRPADSRGNMDILVRHRRNGIVRLAVWELKQPGVVRHAMAQAYIYAATLALILRSPNGPAWYRIFGFRGAIPEKLEIEAVAVVSPDQEQAILRQAQRLEARMVRSLPGLDTTVSLFAFLIDPGTMGIRQVRL